ncbi:MAG: hypothetical protein Q8903_08440, partial [Bacteroidota bacterium]|nr:hypothetical protein [Bacteroidota bacterium]
MRETFGIFSEAFRYMIVFECVSFPSFKENKRNIGCFYCIIAVIYVYLFQNNYIYNYDEIIFIYMRR